MGFLKKLDRALMDGYISAKKAIKEFDYDGASQKIESFATSMNESVEKKKKEMERKYGAQ